MVDAGDSKSPGSNPMRVRAPPWVDREILMSRADNVVSLKATTNICITLNLKNVFKNMKEDESMDSFRSSLDANYDWPSLYPFKFIVPKDSVNTVLDLFADDPVRAKESSSGRFTAFTMEMNVHSSDEVIAIYQRVAQVEGVISL